MSELVYLLVAVLAAGAAWYFSRARAERSYSGRLAEAGGRAQAAEAIALERERQIRERESELSGLRESASRQKDLCVQAETRLEEAEKSLAEQRALLEVMKKELTDAFGALSSAALKSSSEDFLRLASEHLGKVLAETQGRMGEHKAAMDGLLGPLSEALRKYDEQIRSIELKRKQDFTSLDEQIKGLATTHRDLQRETGNLVAALRKPHVRGRWGEITLRNVVELAGMSSHCDFTEQLSLNTEAGRLRPDMVVHLPGGNNIVVDSKVSLEALLDVFSAQSEEARREAQKRHAGHVREHVSRLGGKSYWGQFPKSPELVVLFTSEAALVAALEAEPTMLEDSMARRVLVATPTTLFALLTAVAYGWRQEQMTKNSESIAALGRELYERVSVWAGHLSQTGRDLGRAVESYNKAVGSLESRVLPSVRKFKELGATGAEDIPEVKQEDKSPRDMSLLQ